MSSIGTNSLSYLITVSQAHIIPSIHLINTLRHKTKNQIVVVGNLNKDGEQLFKKMNVEYINENDIDMSNRLPIVNWTTKYREFGWYKQMFIRLCIDRFMSSEQVIILDSEVFVFNNWDESRFYDPISKKPRSLYWIPKFRKPDWDYKMYRGAAYLLKDLPECAANIMDYANTIIIDDTYQVL